MLKRILNTLILLAVSVLVTGCAVGSATSGYALRSQTADSLSSDAEQRIVDRTKKEIMSEMK